jgi:membrane protease YdiL (CAAX protease family)
VRAAARPLLPALAIAVSVAAALYVRVAVAAAGGVPPTSSLPAAALFALLLFGLAAATREARAAGTGLRRGSVMRNVAVGAVGGALLVAIAVVLPALPVRVWPRPSAGQVAPWTLLVVCIAVAEEWVFRGGLFDALARARGAVVAALVCAMLFAAVHVPLYGLRALPLDVGAGLWLGGLRMLTGGVAAPAAAHAVADCGVWLLL